MFIMLSIITVTIRHFHSSISR